MDDLWIWPPEPTRVVNLKEESYDVRIDRLTKWGNPYIIGKDGTREEVIEKYRNWIVKQPDLMNSIDELKGKRLGCWCHPNPCHGDVLIDLINNKGLILF